VRRPAEIAASARGCGRVAFAIGKSTGHLDRGQPGSTAAFSVGPNLMEGFIDRHDYSRLRVRTRAGMSKADGRRPFGDSRDFEKAGAGAYDAGSEIRQSQHSAGLSERTGGGASGERERQIELTEATLARFAAGSGGWSRRSGRGRLGPEVKAGQDRRREDLDSGRGGRYPPCVARGGQDFYAERRRENRCSPHS